MAYLLVCCHCSSYQGKSQIQKILLEDLSNDYFKKIIDYQEFMSYNWIKIILKLTMLLKNAQGKHDEDAKG